MQIVYNTLSEESKGLIDALQIVQDTGSESKESSLQEVSQEIRVTDKALENGKDVTQIDTLLDYRNKLQNVKSAIEKHFI